MKGGAIVDRQEFIDETRISVMKFVLAVLTMSAVSQKKASSSKQRSANTSQSSINGEKL